MGGDWKHPSTSQSALEPRERGSENSRVLLDGVAVVTDDDTGALHPDTPLRRRHLLRSWDPRLGDSSTRGTDVSQSVFGDRRTTFGVPVPDGSRGATPDTTGARTWPTDRATRRGRGPRDLELQDSDWVPTRLAERRRPRTREEESSPARDSFGFRKEPRHSPPHKSSPVDREDRNVPGDDATEFHLKSLRK